MKKMVKLVMASVLLSVPIFAQNINITGTVVDSSNSQAVSGAAVKILEEPQITALTNVNGSFTLNRAQNGTGRLASSNDGLVKLTKNGLFVNGAIKNKVVTVSVYQCNGIRIYHARKIALTNNTLVFDKLWNTPGLYFVNIHIDGKTYALMSIGANHASTQIKSFEPGSLGKVAAIYTLQISMSGYKTKEVTTASATGDVGTIKICPDGGVPPGWPSYDEAASSSMSTRVLVLLVDFVDTDMSSYLPGPDVAWAGLMFGRKQGQANNYFYQITRGRFQLLPAQETFGQANDGVVHVHISAKKPTSGTYTVEKEAWIPEALDLAAKDVAFADFDKNSDGMITNDELTVLIPLNLDYARIAGEGAQANIFINHPIAGTSVTLQNFLRVEDDYTSIGTPSHELCHHIFGLKHTASPTQHDLMGLGAYAEDPVITLLHDHKDHYATRPTGLMAYHQVAMKLVTPTVVTATAKGIKLNSPHRLDYNVIRLPMQDGYILLENRTAEGYDLSIPFCSGHTGGIFVTEVSQYVQPLNLPQISALFAAATFEDSTWAVCNTYAVAGHNDSFSIGQYTISNVSAAGPVMTLDITKRDLTTAIDHYDLKYWINNPNKPGYRMWHWVRAAAGATTDVDFASFPSGSDPTAWFAIDLEAFYNTGEVRSVNAEATWTSASSYLVPEVFPINLTMPKSDAIVNLKFVPTEAKTTTAVFNVQYGSFATNIRFINIP
jgi:hypothetical protein